jgi:SNF2 family DNA or RNA helicase
VTGKTSQLALRPAMPHQLDALDWAFRRSNLPLFMEMRLGKSLVATRWAQSKSPRRVLIVAPSSTIPGWLDELEAEGIAPSFLTGPRQQRVVEARDSDGWFITNYEGICIPIPSKGRKSRAIDAPLLSMAWDVMILDESTRIKNPQANITQAFLTKTYNTMSKALLSGYPAPESPLDYFCQMVFLYGSFMNCTNWWSFRGATHVNAPDSPLWFPRHGAIGTIKREVRKKSFVLTRRQAKIGSQILNQRRVVPMNKLQTQMCKQIDDEFAVNLRSGGRIETKWVIVNLNWLGRIAGGFDPEGGLLNDAKWKEIKYLLDTELHGEQVVIWFRYNRELRHVYERLRAAKITCRAIWGKTGLERRRKIQHMFKRHKVRVLLVQVKCGKMGIDFSAADTAIYYSNGYSNEDRAQSQDRLIHPKKTTPVLLIDIQTAGSVDVNIRRVLRKKDKVGRSFMNMILKERYGRGYARRPVSASPSKRLVQQDPTT